MASLCHSNTLTFYCHFKYNFILNLDHPPTTRPFFWGQNNQKLCLSFCHSLVSHLTSFFCTIYFIEFWFFVRYSIPQRFTVYQTLAASLLAIVFWQVFYWLAANYILTYFPEIQKIFSWFTTKCTGLTLGSII